MLQGPENILATFGRHSAPDKNIYAPEEKNPEHASFQRVYSPNESNQRRGAGGNA